MATDVAARVADLIGFIRSGKIVEAMEEFYAEDVSMQENANAPTVGLAANIEREKQFLASVREFHGYEALSVGIDASRERALVESAMEFTNTEGQRVKLESVAVQQWRDGKIASERFYYDSAGG